MNEWKPTETIKKNELEFIEYFVLNCIYLFNQKSIDVDNQTILKFLIFNKIN